MMTRAKAAWWLAMALAAMTCAASSNRDRYSAASAGPQGTGAQGISPQGTQPATAGRQSSGNRDDNGKSESGDSAWNRRRDPEQNKLAPANGGLTSCRS